MIDLAKTSTVLMRDYAQMQRDLEKARKQRDRAEKNNRSLRRALRRWKERAWAAEAKLKEAKDG